MGGCESILKFSGETEAHLQGQIALGNRPSALRRCNKFLLVIFRAKPELLCPVEFRPGSPLLRVASTRVKRLRDTPTLVLL